MLAALRALITRTRTWLRLSQADRDFNHELESHLDMLTQENIRCGMAPEEARRAARLRLGGLTQLKETHHELHGLPLLETFLQDTRYAFRILGKERGFAAVAIFTLALGIGANTAIFSVVYAVLLKPLPYAKPDQLFNVFQQRSEDESVKTGWSYPNFTELRERNRSFSEMAGAQRHQLTLTGRGEPSVVNTSVVTAEFFSLFGEKPLVGRFFFTEDGNAGAPPVAMLSETLWRHLFAADPNIVGSSIQLDQRSFTVVGIMPAKFRFPMITQSEQIWIPLMQDPLFGPWTGRRTGHWLQVIGRLKPGVSIGQAHAELNVLAAGLAKGFPAENTGWVIRTIPLQAMITGNVKQGLLLLLGAVGLVLLIGCTNIANLLLARATSRTREMAVRAALGAGRTRIIRQLLSESAVLGLIGGAAGTIFAFWGVRALSSLLPPSIPQVNAIRVDYLVLAFALLLSTAAGCAFGLAPSFLVANAGLQTRLREGGRRSGESGKRRRARNFLAAAEIAVAMVLLVAAGLLLRSFARLTAVNPGFEPNQIVKAEVSLPRFQYSTPQQWLSFSDRLLAGVQAEPGLQDTAIAIPAPLANGSINLSFDIEGSPPLSAGASREGHYVVVSPEYFRVMSIPLSAGRIFDQRDILSAPRVALISSALARTYFPNRNPVGKRLIFGFPPGGRGVPREIIGVVGDVRDVSLGDDPRPMMYVPFAQEPFAGAVLVVRSNLGTSGVGAAIRRVVTGIDRDLPLNELAAMPEVLTASVAQPRFRTFLLGLFAAMALVLAATGIFSVVSYSVSCRTQEIGIRMALGASRGAILRMVSRETLTLTFFGLALGLPCALGASRLAGHLLFGVQSNDPATLAAAALALGAVAALAGYVPVRRAMRVDPITALRHE